jgi:hypothetical protein
LISKGLEFNITELHPYRNAMIMDAATTVKLIKVYLRWGRHFAVIGQLMALPGLVGKMYSKIHSS